MVAGCKTSHEVTRTTYVKDSTSLHVRDSADQVISQLKQRYELDIQAIKNTGVIFATDCPPTTISIDANCNYDSVQRIINSLRNSVRINKDGSIDAYGRLAGAYSNYDSIRHESAERDSLNQRLVTQHNADSSSIQYLTDSYHSLSQSKPGGVLAAWPWMLVALGSGIVIGYRIKKKV